MSIWRQLSHGLRALTRRDSVGTELDDEVRDYYDRAHADLVDQGLSAQEADQIMRRKLGDPDRAREDLASYGWENTAENTFADLRHAARRLRQSPGSALVVILTLALGIGASTAIFSAVFPVLFEPLPYPNADRVVFIEDRDGNGAPLDVTYGTYLEVAARSRSFERLAVTDQWRPALVGGGESERLTGSRVTADYFRVLGVAPAIGRNFEPADENIGEAQFVIVSDAFAKRRFGSADAILNQMLMLDDRPHLVIGVMPPGFENVLEPAVEVWSSVQYRTQAPFESGEWGHHMRMVGRLLPGVQIEQAVSELATIGADQIEAFPRPRSALMQKGLVIESLQRSVTAASRPVLLAILSAVLLLLVIACANVTNILLARSVRRRSELAVRAALGAGRGRLARQLLTESLLLAVLGGGLGLGVAVVGIEGIVAIAPAGLPRVDAIDLDASAFLFALAVTTLSGIAVGLVPALRGTRPDLRVDLHTGVRSTGGSHHALRRGLVVTEVALALVLMAGAGLLLRSVDKLLSTPPGFDASNLLTMQIVATRYGAETPAKTLQYFESVLDAVRSIPGVTDAAFTSQLPLSGDLDAYGFRFETTPESSLVSASRSSLGGALRYVVTPEWFRTMGIPLLDGRLIDARDRPGAPEAVLVSESFANRWFADRSPIGERIRFGPEIGQPDRPWDIIVGVVGDVKQTSLALTSGDAFYVAMGQWSWVDTVQSLVVRTDVAPAVLVPSIRQAIWSADSAPPIAGIATMEELVAASESDRRFALTVFALFAAASLALAALGLYGVMAGSVEERTREIGLRSALGASPANILALVVRQGLVLAGLGVGIGIVAAMAATRGLQSMLFNVTALDPVTYAAVVVVIVGVAAVACWLPAWRGSRVDPTIALRSE